MNPLSPTDLEWKELYKAAAEFKEIKCWDWMDDTDLFGVENPASSEIGYCCVLGALGEVFGLNVYLGAEGLEGYFRMQSSEDGETDQIEAFYQQKSLAVTFENKSDLDKKDREVIKRLGLNLTGRKSWPLFRSYRPGYQPWYLTKDEAVFLTIALQQAREVALNFKEGWHLLNPPSEDHCLVRMAVREEGISPWKDRWLKLPQPEKTELVIPPVDEIRLGRIKNAGFRKSSIWECDFFYTPAAIQGDGEDRPYFPVTFLWVDHQTGLILKSELLEHGEYRANFQKGFLNLIEEARSLPLEVKVKKEETYKLLEPIARRLAIQLDLTRSAPALEEAKEAMLNFFMSKK